MGSARRWAVALGATATSFVSVLLLAPATGAATVRSPFRWWHGTLIENLDAPGVAPALAISASSSPVANGAQPNSQKLAPQAAGKSKNPRRPRTIILSNERTFTRWAYVRYLGPIFADPSGSSRRIGRLHWNTSDGFSEVYLLLREYINAQGYAWVRLRIPARPNGQIGWVRRSALGRFNLSYWLLVVNRWEEQLTAYHFGRRVFTAPVGVGKPSTPTPAGHFWIRERFRVLDPSSPYYPYAMGTADFSTLSEWPGGGVVGIHGAWGQPWLIPGDPSHGCIRMHNNDVSWLVPRVPIGTPLHVI